MITNIPINEYSFVGSPEKNKNKHSAIKSPGTKDVVSFMYFYELVRNKGGSVCPINEADEQTQLQLIKDMHAVIRRTSVTPELL